jgi:hypothetical protein
MDDLRKLTRDHLRPGEIKELEEAGEEVAHPPIDSVKGAESIAGRQDQNQTELINAGAGGATEHAGRQPHHEAMPSPINQPNS